MVFGSYLEVGLWVQKGKSFSLLKRNNFLKRLSAVCCVCVCDVREMCWRREQKGGRKRGLCRMIKRCVQIRSWILVESVVCAHGARAEHRSQANACVWKVRVVGARGRGTEKRKSGARTQIFWFNSIESLFNRQYRYPRISPLSPSLSFCLFMFCNNEPRQGQWARQEWNWPFCFWAFGPQPKQEPSWTT